MILQDKRFEIFLLLVFFSSAFFFPAISYIAIIVFLLIYPIKNKITYKLILFYSLVLFSFFISQKYIGGQNDDFAVYIKMLREGSYPTWNIKPFDFFFWYVSSIIFSFTQNGVYFIFIISCLSFFPVIIFFLGIMNERNESVIFNCLFFGFFSFLFVCSMSFWNLYGNYLRQAWVMSFSLLGVMSLSHQRYGVTLIWATFALITHSTGIIVFSGLLGMFLLRNYNKKIIVNVLLISALLMMVINPLHFILPYLPSSIASKLNFYLEWRGLSFGVVATYRIAAIALFIFIINFSFNIFRKDDVSLNVLLILSIYCFICLSVSVIPKAVERLYYPAMVFFFLFLARVMAILYVHLSQVQENRIILKLTVIPTLISFFLFSLYITLNYNLSYYNGIIENFLFYSPVIE